MTALLGLSLMKVQAMSDVINGALAYLNATFTTDVI